MKKFILILGIVCCYFFGLSSVFASNLEDCTNNTRYIDYTNIYQSMGNNQQLKNFYTDFKDWFDSQSNYQYYYIIAQGGNDDLIHYYISVFNNTSYFDILNHNFSSRYNSFSIGTLNSSNAISGVYTLSTTDLIFDSNNFTYGIMKTSSFGGNSSSLPHDSYHFTFDWVYSNTGMYTNGTIIFIDFNNPITLGNTGDFINLKIGDDYYCASDTFPSLNSVYSLYNDTVPIDYGFYNKAQEILGTLPPQYNILYVITSLLLFVGIFLIIFIPLIIFFKKCKK